MGPRVQQEGKRALLSLGAGKTRWRCVVYEAKKRERSGASGRPDRWPIHCWVIAARSLCLV